MSWGNLQPWDFIFEDTTNSMYSFHLRHCVQDADLCFRVALFVLPSSRLNPVTACFTIFNFRKTSETFSFSSTFENFGLGGNGEVDRSFASGSQVF